MDNLWLTVALVGGCLVFGLVLALALTLGYRAGYRKGLRQGAQRHTQRGIAEQLRVEGHRWTAEPDGWSVESEQREGEA